MKDWGQPPTAHHDTLERILVDARACRGCAMFQSRRNLVFGEGDPCARLMFVGKAPGPEEDAQGKPFVGPAGELLTKIINAMKLTRSQVYLCNITKCGPSLDSPLRVSDINTCYSFLKRQINVIKPEFICTLGTVAVQVLLRTKEPLSSLRGRFHDFHGITLMPTHAPDYLLQNEDKKRDVWEDMKKLMKAMER
jgi:DNA polymerase